MAKIKDLVKESYKEHLSDLAEGFGENMATLVTEKLAERKAEIAKDYFAQSVKEETEE